MNKEAKKILILSSLVWIVSNLLHPVTPPTHFTNLNLPDHVFGTSYAAMVFFYVFDSTNMGGKYR